MEGEQTLFVKLSPIEYREIKHALEVVDKQRKAAREAAKRKREKEGKPPIESGSRIEPVNLRVLTIPEMLNEVISFYNSVSECNQLNPVLSSIVQLKDKI
jgi:hypothetical protein